MKLWAPPTLALLVLVALLAPAAAGWLDKRAPKHQASEVRATLGRWFDFRHFNELFQRHYASPLEESARHKLFQTRVFQVFLRWVSFKRGRSSSYLAINSLSDRTKPEIEATWKVARVGAALEQEVSLRTSEPAPKAEALVAAEEVAADSDIEAAFEFIEEHRKLPGYSQIAADLEQVMGERRAKRSLGELGRPAAELARPVPSLADLMRLPEPEGSREASARLRSRIPSNNPQYSAPELMSLAAGSEAPASPLPALPESLAKRLARASGFDFLKRLVTRTVAFLTGNKAPAEAGDGDGHGDEDEDLDDGVEMFTPKKLDLDQPDEEADEGPDTLFVDHRASGCLAPVRSQGICGSCYIFSTVALYEFVHCFQTGQLVPLSEQYAIDCGARAGLGGCKGGQEPEMATFVGQFGLELRANYPQTVGRDHCPYEAAAKPESMGYLRSLDVALVATREHNFALALKVSPLVVAVAVGHQFAMYGGGVDECRYSSRYGGHSMLLVGQGRESGRKYWLLRNSYGADWGELGYYRLAASSDCFYEARGYASRAHLNDKQLFEAHANKLYNPATLEARRHGSELGNVWRAYV